MDQHVSVCRGAETTVDIRPVANHDRGGVTGDAGRGRDGVIQMDAAAATPHDQFLVILSDCTDSKVAGRPFVIVVVREEIEMRPQVDRAIRKHPK